VGILAASAVLPVEALSGYVFAGELSSSGDLRPVRGALAMAQAMRQEAETAALVLPSGSAQEAALVPGTRVYRVQNLQALVQALASERPRKPRMASLQVQILIATANVC
jgi:magnesium chelatase family protein